MLLDLVEVAHMYARAFALRCGQQMGRRGIAYARAVAVLLLAAASDWARPVCAEIHILAGDDGDSFRILVSGPDDSPLRRLDRSARAGAPHRPHTRLANVTCGLARNSSRDV